jgi:hypothetical protein
MTDRQLGLIYLWLSPVRHPPRLPLVTTLHLEILGRSFRRTAAAHRQGQGH